MPTRIPSAVRDFVGLHAARLGMLHPMFSLEWLQLREQMPTLAGEPWTQQWAIVAHERLRTRRMIEAVVGELYGLSFEDLEAILDPDESDPIGFWRADKDLPPEQRLPAVVLQAFRGLRNVGLEAFCSSEWELPKHARQFDRGGVSNWAPTEDWTDCERHALAMRTT